MLRNVVNSFLQGEELGDCVFYLPRFPRGFVSIPLIRWSSASPFKWSVNMSQQIQLLLRVSYINNKLTGRQSSKRLKSAWGVAPKHWSLQSHFMNQNVYDAIVDLCCILWVWLFWCHGSKYLWNEFIQSVRYMTHHVVSVMAYLITVSITMWEESAPEVRS